MSTDEATTVRVVASPTPAAVEPTAQERVDEVVAAGDAVEHRTHRLRVAFCQR